MIITLCSSLCIVLFMILIKSKKVYQLLFDNFHRNEHKKEKYNANISDPESERINGNGGCYPKCASDVWLRSCEREIIEPIQGHITGTIPFWLRGSLLRNGPGSWNVGDMKFQHLFDCSALLHRFAINNGHVTYQNRFIQTETLKKNTTAQRIVVTEFGTASVLDPCHSIFDKISSIFRADSGSDNSMISIYPFGDEYYTFTETPFVHKINPITLSTEGRKCMTDIAGVINHTSHPHVMPNGTVYNLGMAASKSGISYNIICFPHGEHMFEKAYVVGSIPCRWKLNPGYMHTFGVTENYFVIVEQPLSVSLTSLAKAQFYNQNLCACLKWFDTKPTLFHLMDRKTGKVVQTFEADTFFYLHIINQYEDDDNVVIDICCYKDPEMINCMYLESIINMQSNPNYASLFRARPLRFVLPLQGEIVNCNDKISSARKLIESFSLSNISGLLQKSKLKKSNSEYMNISPLTENNRAHKKPQQNFYNKLNILTHEHKVVRPELLCNIGCETPRINYERFSGKKYRYFYAISCDVDAERPGMLIKVDTVTKTTKSWFEENCYPSEPIFVPSPNSSAEDDGVILSAMVWGGVRDNYVGLLVLCAITWTELGRCEFHTNGPVPKCLHGWFANNI